MAKEKDEVMELLQHVQDQQGETLDMLTTVLNNQSRIEDRLDVLEAEHAVRSCKPTSEQIKADKQKAWIPVVLKLLEIISIIVGVALGVNVLN